MDTATTTNRHALRQYSPIRSNVRVEREDDKQQNRVFIENGEVKLHLVSDAIDIEEARTLLHKMVELEYSLP